MNSALHSGHVNIPGSEKESKSKREKKKEKEKKEERKMIKSGIHLDR